MELAVKCTPRMERIGTLARAFENALSPAQLGNLQFHVRAQSPICCGKLGWWFIHKDTGAAAVEVLANTRTPMLLREYDPETGTLVESIDSIYRTTFLELVRSAGVPDVCRRLDNPGLPLSDYMQAILDSTEQDVRKAISLVI